MLVGQCLHLTKFHLLIKQKSSINKTSRKAFFKWESWLTPSQLKWFQSSYLLQYKYAYFKAVCLDGHLKISNPDKLSGGFLNKFSP